MSVASHSNLAFQIASSDSSSQIQRDVKKHMPKAHPNLRVFFSDVPWLCIFMQNIFVIVTTIGIIYKCLSNIDQKALTKDV